MKFKIGKCQRCGQIGEFVKSNNPLLEDSICFDCIKKILHYNNLQDADFFCRTFNFPLDPELWMNMADDIGEEVFQEYARAQLDEDGEIKYKGSADQTWEKMNTYWSRMKTQAAIMTKIEPFKNSYIQREGLIWGEQYDFAQLLELDSLYIQTLQANKITNPLQKKALRTLLKVMMDMDQAILEHDPNTLKALSSSFQTLSKTAQLDQMIEESKTEDLTTLAEVAELLEREGFEMPYYDGGDRDAIDFAIKNIQETNAALIKESTGLAAQIESIVNRKKMEQELSRTDEATSEISIEDLMQNYEELEVAEEADETVLEEDFSHE